MKNLWKGLPALLLFASVGAVMGSGCVDAEGMFFVASVKAQGCDDITVDGPFLSGGRMDLRYSCNYYAVLELGNQLVHRGDETKLQIETSRISVTAVDVQVLEADGETPVGDPFTYPTSGFIDPATSGNPGRGLTGALLIDGGVAGAIAQRGGGLFITRTIVRGRTLGGDDIETRPFDFPVEVCIGCLCVEPSNDTCIESSSSPSDQCFFPQDQKFDCRWLNGHDCDEPAVCGQF